MGFYLRKSLSLGPFRFNLSGSGVGVSAGVRGLRVGSGPRGNYVHLGRAGVYYRHTFSPDAVQHASPQEIDSGAAAEIVDSSSEELLEEIRARRRRFALKPFAILGTVLFLLMASGWARAFAALLGVAFILAASYRDRRAKTVVIHYDFEPKVEEAFRRFTEWAEALARAGQTWHIAATGSAYDRRYHAGASNLVQRNATTVRTAQPPFLDVNVPVLSIGAGQQTLYFLPDRLLVYDAGGIGAVSYRTLEISVHKQRFIEEGRVPADATVVDHTWQYANKDGSRDRRFGDNRQIPVCLYDELTFRTSSGLNEVIQVSRAGLGEGFVAAVRYLASVTS